MKSDDSDRPFYSRRLTTYGADEAYSDLKFIHNKEPHHGADLCCTDPSKALPGNTNIKFAKIKRTNEIP